MKLDFYTPENKILKEYIEGYYFISEDRISKSISYYTFPNNFCILSVNQNAEVQLKDGKFLVSRTDNRNIVADFVSRYSEPLEIIYENAVNEITIYFKPLGVNHFIDNLDIFKQSQITDFIPFPDFQEIMELVFNQPNRKKQIQLLENYWLSKFIRKDLTLIEQILSDIEADFKIEEIAEKYNFTRQYINKLFSKKVGKTPSEYRKIYRFRNTLKTVKKTKNLTQLSHGNLFYDQSHFIKDFHALTNTNPSSFFKNVDIEKENIWLFI